MKELTKWACLIFRHTNLMAVAAVVACTAFVPSRATAAEVTKMIFLESAEAPRVLQQDRLETSLELLMKELGIAESALLPQIVIIHISKKEAAGAGLEKVSATLRFNQASEQAGPYYELWLVEEPTAFESTYCLALLLRHHFQLRHSGAELEESADYVVRSLNATISAKAVRRRHQRSPRP